MMLGAGSGAASVLWAAVTIGLYFLFLSIYRRRPSIATLPIVATTLVVIAILAITRADLATYRRGTAWLVWLLGPATVALAVPFARRFSMLRARLGALVIAPAIGAVIGAFAAAALARAFGLSRVLVATLTPKSVTTPIAMPIAAHLGGEPALTAAIVIVTGVLGLAFGPFVLDRLGVRSPMARGAALGTAAHGVGTARAIEEGEVEGAAAGVAMIVAGVVTAFVARLAFAVATR